MRSKTWLACALMVLGVGLEARANLALSLNPNATISTLSAQLLKKPRSQAGNKVNVWDCDPPDALQGMHYFAYNIGPSFDPLPANNRVITLRSFEAGPGYTANAQVLVQGGGDPFFMDAQANSTFDFTGLNELGLARVSFTATGTPRGQIDPAGDVDEIAYDAKDINGVSTNVRGVEHVRFTTEYLANDPISDNLIARGLVTTIAPTSFGSATGQAFPQGYLDFGGTFLSTGDNVFPAFVQTPEPASLAALAVAGVIFARRRPT